MKTKPSREILEYAVSGVNAEYEAAMKRAEEMRAKKYARIRNWWLEEGGSEQDLDFAPSKVSASPVAETPVARKSRQTRARANGSGGQTISKSVIQEFVGQFMDDPNIEVVSQTDIKDKVLREYPDAKVPSVRSAITNELVALKDQGQLELVEEGRAGTPNKYRKTRNLF